MISVVIPVFKSAETLPELHESLTKVMSSLRDNDYELIFVEDGSLDQSWNAICELAQNDERILGIKLARNYGQHNALLCGIRAASKELIVIMDDDLQNPPEEIPRLIAELGKGYDVVYGNPEKQQHGLFRNWAAQVTKFMLQSVMGAETARKVGPFKVFRASLKKAFKDFRGPYVNIDVLLTWATTRFSGVSVRHIPRAAGGSGYTFWKLTTHAFNMMTGFSTFPLQLASVTGFFFAILGFLVLVFVLIQYLYEGRVVPGFAFLASVIAIFSGVQLFALGMIGEYLARIHFRTMDKPSYVIDERITGRQHELNGSNQN